MPNHIATQRGNEARTLNEYPSQSIYRRSRSLSHPSCSRLRVPGRVPGRGGLLVSVSASHAVGRGFGSYPGHTIDYYPYRAFGGQNKIVYSTRFVKRRAILLRLSGLYVTNHLTLNYVYDMYEFIVPRIALCPAHLSYCCCVPQAFAFLWWQNGSRQSPTIVR